MSSSSVETERLGEAFAKTLAAKKTQGKHAVVVALRGDLGAGKTTFIKGFAKGLGVRRRIVSPTFIIMRRFGIRGARPARFKNFYHFDVYRLRDAAALEVIGFREIIADPRAIVLIEWADKIKRMVPKDAVWIAFRHGKGQEERIVYINN